MSRYSLERKNAVINKFHSDNTLSLSEIARQESIPTSTLYNWLKQVNLVGNAMSKNAIRITGLLRPSWRL